MKILLATRNRHKIREISDIFSTIGTISLVTPDEAGDLPDVDETESTFAGNALLKAAALCHATGLATLSDDSGLVVDALGGRPGVYSARYGGPGLSDHDRCLLLLDEMKDQDRRQARFVCVMALVLPDGRRFTAEGVCEGEIARGIHGSHGFGYDPVFLLADRNMTMAELPPEIKNSISHRARALEAMARILAEIAGRCTDG